MEVKDLLAHVDEDMAEVQAQLSAANGLVAELKKRLDGLIETRRTLEAAAYTYCDTDELPAPIFISVLDPNDWRLEKRVNAIERLLRESGEPLHLSEIAEVLVSHERTNDTPELISASLAYLKRSRGSVAATGGGRWRFVPEQWRMSGRDEDIPGAATFTDGTHSGAPLD